MAKFVLLLVGLAVIQASLALKCKSCTGSCAEMQDDICPATKSGDSACLTFVWTDKDGKNKMTEKKCVILTNDKYDCVPTKSTDKQEKCDICKEDFCNEKSAANTLGCLGLVGVVAALFASKLF